MKKQVFLALLVMTVCSALLLSGCSDFDEMKSNRLLSRAESLLDSGKELQAESVLEELLAKYPETQSAETAEKYLLRIKQQREIRVRDEFSKILESYQDVFSGYQSLYTQYPPSLAELDKSGYMFDSAYLDEITPEGYQIYLWLKEDGSGYRIWGVADGKERGFALDSRSGKLVPFATDDVVDKIASRFQSENISNKLVALKLK